MHPGSTSRRQRRGHGEPEQGGPHDLRGAVHRRRGQEGVLGVHEGDGAQGGPAEPRRPLRRVELHRADTAVVSDE